MWAEVGHACHFTVRYGTYLINISHFRLLLSFWSHSWWLKIFHTLFELVSMWFLGIFHHLEAHKTIQPSIHFLPRYPVQGRSLPNTTLRSFGKFWVGKQSFRLCFSTWLTYVHLMSLVPQSHPLLLKVQPYLKKHKAFLLISRFPLLTKLALAGQSWENN